jgi:hypothetical protein
VSVRLAVRLLADRLHALAADARHRSAVMADMCRARRRCCSSKRSMSVGTPHDVGPRPQLHARDRRSG